MGSWGVFFDSFNWWLQGLRPPIGKLWVAKLFLLLLLSGLQHHLLSRFQDCQEIKARWWVIWERKPSPFEEVRASDSSLSPFSRTHQLSKKYLSNLGWMRLEIIQNRLWWDRKVGKRFSISFGLKNSTCHIFARFFTLNFRSNNLYYRIDPFLVWVFDQARQTTRDTKFTWCMMRWKLGPPFSSSPTNHESSRSERY